MMLKKLNALIGVALFVALMSGTANAALTTWNFTGVVSYGYARAGQIVTGSVSFDPALIPVTAGNGTTSSQGGMNIFPPFGSSLGISGIATDGSLNAVVDGVSFGNTAWITLQKGNLQGQSGYYDDYSIEVLSTVRGGVSSIIDFYTYEVTDGNSASGIFSNTNYLNPDLSFTQDVNWFSRGAISGGSLINTQNGLNENFVLTSVTKTVIPEPESLFLVAVALVALVVVRRKYNGRCTQHTEGHSVVAVCGAAKKAKDKS